MVRLTFLFLSVLLSLGAQAEDVAVFRLGDVSAEAVDRQEDLGHCTGFYVYDSGQVLTAGHCNHHKDMRILDSQGDTLVDLSTADRFYMTHPLGPLDVAVLKVSTTIEAQIKAEKDLLYLPVASDLSIAGYPQAFREKPLSVFSCELISGTPPFSKAGVENQLFTTHLNCPHLNHISTAANVLRHQDVAGLSGAPVFWNKELIGVAYHYDEPRLHPEGRFKVQLFSDHFKIEEENRVIQRFNLHRKLFEEAKIPNLINLQIDHLILLELGLPISYRQELKNIRWISDTQIEISFEKETFTLPSNTLPSSLTTFLKATR